MDAAAPRGASNETGKRAGIRLQLRGDKVEKTRNV